MDRAEEVILLVVEHRICHSHAGCNEFGDASLDERFREFRVFELVADGNAFACPDELRQVGVEGMIGEAGHCDALCRTRLAVVPVGEGDAEDFSSNHRIVGIRLVEVAATEQQQRLGVLRLEVVELLHHGCQRFLCHLVCRLFVVHNLISSAKLRKKSEERRRKGEEFVSAPRYFKSKAPLGTMPKQYLRRVGSLPTAPR